MNGSRRSRRHGRVAGMRFALRGRRGRYRRRGRRSGWRGGTAADVARRLGGARARRRKEEKRVEVSLFLGGRADPEVDVGNVELGDAARPDGPDGISFPHGVPAPNSERAEVYKRHRVPLRRLDGHGLATARDAAGEGDAPRGRRDDRSTGVSPDVDSPVLAPGVRVRRVERESHQHRARHRPGPAERRGRDHQRSGGGESEHTHRADLRCQVRKRRRHGSSGDASLSNQATATCRKDACGRLR